LVIGVLAIVVALILVVKREWIILSGWLAAFYGGGLLGRVLEAFVQRPGMHRTAIFGGTLGLPTGHAMGSLIGYGLLAYLLVGFVVKRRTAQTAIVTAAALLVFAIGFSRLYLGALYFSVMIGVYAAGVVWLATCITGIEIARRQRPLTASEVGLDAVQSAA
jgi:undecaprenyl-diphosphatase